MKNSPLNIDWATIKHVDIDLINGLWLLGYLCGRLQAPEIRAFLHEVVLVELQIGFDLGE